MENMGINANALKEQIKETIIIRFFQSQVPEESRSLTDKLLRAFTNNGVPIEKAPLVLNDILNALNEEAKK